MREKKNPIIIIGMHRSGTTLISKILQDFGVFMGFYKEKNEESKYFLKFNDWILKQTYSTWDSPENFLMLDNNSQYFFEQICRQSIRSPISNIRYFGWNKFLKGYSFKNPPKYWGWKDPRNTFTIDLWKQVFPDARIIHIYRNPVDIAVSLRKRESEKKAQLISSNPSMIKILSNKGRIANVSFRLTDYEECFNVWKLYVEKSFNVDSDCLHIKYEDFLTYPEEIIYKILNHVNLNIQKSTVEDKIKQINVDRKYAFYKKTEMISFYEKIKNDSLIQRLGYDKII